MPKRQGNIFEILKVLTYKEWIVKYKGTYLGYLWSIAHPLMLATVFYIGFKIVMKVPIPNYTLFLVVALFPWQWFVNSVGSGTWSFVANAALIKKTLFPKYLLPLSNVMVDMLHFLVSLPVIAIILYLYHQPLFYISWIWLLPLMLLLQVALSFFLSLLFGTLNLFYRDIDRLVSLLLTLLMYLSPVFYATEMIPEKFRPFFYLNPVFPLINMWRDLFMHGTVAMQDLTIMLLHLLLLYVISFRVYRKYEPYFAERS
jgi:lipopolysaccharide transport system permease protein